MATIISQNSQSQIFRDNINLDFNYKFDKDVQNYTRNDQIKHADHENIPISPREFNLNQQTDKYISNFLSNFTQERSIELNQNKRILIAGKVEDKIDNLSEYQNRNSANFIRGNRDSIFEASQIYGIQHQTIAAVAFQEHRYYGPDDIYLDSSARSWVDFKSQGKEIEAAAFYIQVWGGGKANFDGVTFGKAQIRLDNLKSLISEGRLSKFISSSEFGNMNNDQRSIAALNLVLNESNTPYIIGAWQQKSKEDWLDRGGSPLINEPVNEYKLLTSLYSQYSPGISRVNPNPDLSHNPYSDNSSINKSGRDAISNYGVIWKALYTNDSINGFSTSRLSEDSRFYPNEPLRGGDGNILGNR